MKHQKGLDCEACYYAHPFVLVFQTLIWVLMVTSSYYMPIKDCNVDPARTEKLPGLTIHVTAQMVIMHVYLFC